MLRPACITCSWVALSTPWHHCPPPVCLIPPLPPQVDVLAKGLKKESVGVTIEERRLKVVTIGADGEALRCCPCRSWLGCTAGWRLCSLGGLFTVPALCSALHAALGGCCGGCTPLVRLFLVASAALPCMRHPTVLYHATPSCALPNHTSALPRAGQEDYCLDLQLHAPVQPEESSFQVLSTKVAIKLKKAVAGTQWPGLEAGAAAAPSPAQPAPAAAAAPAAGEAGAAPAPAGPSLAYPYAG